MNTRSKKIWKKARKVFLYNGKANINKLTNSIKELSDDFIKIDKSTESYENLWTDSKQRLQTIIDENIPFKMVHRSNPTPWINSHLKREYRRKQRAYNSLKRKNDPGSIQKYHDLRNRIRRETRRRKRKYIHETTLKYPKQFHSYIKALKTDNSGIPALTDSGRLISNNLQKAKLLNDQFRSVFTKEEPGDIPQRTDRKRSPPYLTSLWTRMEYVLSYSSN